MYAKISVTFFFYFTYPTDIKYLILSRLEKGERKLAEKDNRKIASSRATFNSLVIGRGDIKGTFAYICICADQKFLIP